MIAYAGWTDHITFIDYNTYENLAYFNIPKPDSIRLMLHNLIVSSNRDYLIFTGVNFSSGVGYVVTYSLEEYRIVNIFPVDFDMKGIPDLVAAHHPNNPHLIYLLNKESGYYEIDFLKQEVQLINSIFEYNFHVDFYVSPNKELIAQLINNSEIAIFKTENSIRK